MSEKIATRVAYGKALLEFAPEHPELVVLDADLAGSTNAAVFGNAYPDRFFDLGIAEQNMISVAAGLATCGKHVFASSFAMFAAGRAYEQVRNSIGYTGLNVKIGASHGGISVGEDGASHQCLEDYALMRSIPGMVVMSPADDVETKAMVWAAYEHQGPVYMRFSRYGAPVIHDADRFTFEIGKGEVLREGSDVALIANGLLVAEALEAAELLAQQGISARVIDMATIKPLDEGLVLKAAKECGRLVTCEEHSIIGGTGARRCAPSSQSTACPALWSASASTTSSDTPALPGHCWSSSGCVRGILRKRRMADLANYIRPYWRRKSHENDLALVRRGQRSDQAVRHQADPRGGGHRVGAPQQNARRGVAARGDRRGEKAAGRVRLQHGRGGVGECS